MTAKTSDKILASINFHSSAKKTETHFTGKPIEKKILQESEIAAFLAGEEENDNDDVTTINPEYRHLADQIMNMEEEEIEQVEETPEIKKISSLLINYDYDSELEGVSKAVRPAMKSQGEIFTLL